MANHINQLDLDFLLDALAERVAHKVANRFAETRSPGVVNPRLLTVEQTAAYLGRTKDAIQHMVASRKLTVVRDGRRVFLDVRELDRWIESNKEPAST